MSTKTLTILLILDNQKDNDLLLKHLKDSSLQIDTIDRAKSFEEADKFLQSSRYDIIIFDLDLPDNQGITGFIEFHDEYEDLPMVVLTGVDDKKTALEAIKAGAQDYLVKGKFDGAVLSKVITYSMERQQIVSALLSSQELLRRQKASLEQFGS